MFFVSWPAYYHVSKTYIQKNEYLSLFLHIDMRTPPAVLFVRIIPTVCLAFWGQKTPQTLEVNRVCGVFKHLAVCPQYSDFWTIATFCVRNQNIQETQIYQ